MALSNKFFNKQFVQTTLAIFASIAAVAGFVYAATTIGTNISVDGQLTVSGTSATSTFSTGGFTVGTNQFVVQQTSGNVGIGTTGPVVTLDVQVNNPTGTPELARFQNTNVGNDGSYIFLPRPSDTTRGLKIGHQIGVGTSTYIGVRGGASQDLYTSAGLNNAGVRGFIVLQDSGGNVGIGTTSPGTLLGVQGDIVGAGKLTVSSFAATSTTATSTIFTGGFTIGTSQFVVQQTSGNVGIGTTSPTQLFSVAGDTYIAGTGTTTLNLKTTTASKGTCIEMFDSGGAVRRLYINAAGAITVEAGTCK